MTRREALVALSIAAGLIVGGLTWLFGAVGLLSAGVGLAAIALAIPTRKE
jgi:hypothetical protein